ncbi:TetR/AcrR family transcriptional regulator [Streptomyces sporangiiformans]
MTTMAATAHSSTSAATAHLGLRERKKIKTRAAIRRATYRLIMEQGYDATTIEQIAEAAEVSPSTVFRYFPAKEDIVLTDEYDPLMEAALRARPADEPLTMSLRHVIRDAVEQAMSGEFESPEEQRLRSRLMAEVPAVRSRAMESMSVTGRMMCRIVAERTGRAPDELEVRAYCMGVVGAMMEASIHWAENDHRDNLADLVERTLDVVEHGLTPGKPAAS